MPKLKPETWKLRRLQILDAALACFVRAGYHQSSVDDIVNEAGLSKGAIYTYFEGKEVIFLALLDKMISDMGLLSALKANETDSLIRLKSGASAMAEFISTDIFPSYASLIMEAWVLGKQIPDVRKSMAWMYTQIRDTLTQFIEHGIAISTFKQVDSSIYANQLIATYDGLVIQAMINNQGFDGKAIVKILEENIINNLFLD